MLKVRWGLLSTASIGRLVIQATSQAQHAEFVAVYIALPVSLHTEWTVKALQAGKHVLCEKPFAMTAADAERCFDVAESAGTLCVEGFM